MSQHDDHPADAPDPHDEPLSPGDSPAEAPDPFLELERMFGDLAGPPPLDPSASAAPPSVAPRIEPARLEIPPLLEEDALPSAPAVSEATEAAPAQVSSPEAPVEDVQDSVEALPATLDWGSPNEESDPVEAGAAEAGDAEPAVPEPRIQATEAFDDGSGDRPDVAAAEDDAVIDSTAASQALEETPAAPAPLPAAPSPGALDELVAALDVQTPPAEDFTLAASTAAPAPVGERCIVFELDGTRYALQMGQVIEVADLPSVTPLPHVPAWLLGVSNLRGDILAVLDLRLFLDLGPRPQSTLARMLIVQGAGGLYAGLVVDSVHGVAAVDMAALQPPTAPMDDPVLPLLRGVHQQDDRLLAVLDTNRLLTSDTLRPFAAAQASPGTAQPIYAQASSPGPSAAADGAADLIPSSS